MVDNNGKESLRVAVLSDLHAYDQVENSDDAPSFYCTNEPINGTPIGALLDLIKSENLSADVVLCPGDLGDKANPAGIQDAWNRIHEVAGKLSANTIAGTVGNHDIDSRQEFNKYDPIGFLQQLQPTFPLSNDEENDRYWSRHFVIRIVSPRVRLVVLNSSAFHGVGSEFKHGRISPYTLKRLNEALCGDGQNYAVNILLCHHHPHKHSEFDLGEYDEMKSGQLLLELLGSGDVGDWIVIHGHKHHPKLCYSHGGSSAPTIFSAGSLCHKLYPELSTVAQRQFYMIEFPFSHIEDFGLVGTFRAWDWEYKLGWGQPTRKSGLPSHGGFGYRVKPTILAQKAADELESTIMQWDQFLDSCPEFRYLLPMDIEQVFAKLHENHNVAVSFDGSAMPRQIGRKQ